MRGLVPAIEKRAMTVAAVAAPVKSAGALGLLRVCGIIKFALCGLKAI